MRKQLLFIFAIIFLAILATAYPFIPQGDIRGLNITKIYEITNISANKYCDLSGNCYNVTSMALTNYTNTQVRNIINSTGTGPEFNINVLYLNGSTSGDLDNSWWPLTGNYVYNNSGSLDVNETYLNSTISALDTDTDTNASTACAGTTTYLDGEGNCDDISGVYVQAADWTTIDNYPAACGATEFVRGVGDTLTCADEDNLTITESQVSDADWWDADADLVLNEINESKVNFTSSCAAGNHLYISSGNLACEADADTDTFNTTAQMLAATTSSYVNKSGDTMTGNLNMGDNNITDIDAIYADDWTNVSITESQVSDADWWDEDGDITADEISEGKIAFSTACAAGNHYYLNGNDLACEADDYNSAFDTTAEVIAAVNISSEYQIILNWTQLQNYPSACPANTYLTQLDDTVTCTGISDVYVLNTGDNVTGALNVSANVTVNALIVNNSGTCPRIYTNATGSFIMEACDGSRIAVG